MIIVHVEIIVLYLFLYLNKSLVFIYYPFIYTGCEQRYCKHSSRCFLHISRSCNGWWENPSVLSFEMDCDVIEWRLHFVEGRRCNGVLWKKFIDLLF